MNTSKGASAKDDSANGSRGLTVSNPNVAAGLALVYSHLGNDGDTHTGAHHTEDAAELAALENNLRIEASPIACGDGCVPETMSVAEKKERLGTEILERERIMATQFVLFGESREKMLSEEWEDFKLVPSDG